MARQRNNIPLPTIRSSAGLRLPPDRHSLTACNYHLKSAVKKVCYDVLHFLKKFFLNIGKKMYLGIYLKYILF